MKRTVWCLVVALAGACASASSGPGAGMAGGPVFPTAQELTTITTRPATPPRFDPTRAVDRWQFAEPLPALLGATAHDTRSAAGRLLATRFVANTRVVLSGGMECVAREYGRFWLEHQAMPTPELQTFIQARCGAPVARVGVVLQGGPEPGGEALAGRWQTEAQALLGKLPDVPHAALGLWSGEANGRSVVAAAVGARMIELEPVPLDAGAGGTIELRGRFLDDTGVAAGFATRGGHGFSLCAPVPGTALPRFHFRCAVDARDPTVLVELMAAPAGRLLSQRALVGLFAPGKSAPGEYGTATLAMAAAPMPRRDGAAMLAAINAVRAQAGVAPLREAPAQSAVAARVLPHYVAASTNGDPKVAETVALGMMAGWEVKGDAAIRTGDFASMNLFGVASMDRAVEAVLMTPAHRAVLLDPEAEAIALATQDHASGAATSAIVTTYKFFRGGDNERESQRILDRLDAERAAAGKPPVIRVQGGNSQQPMAHACKRIKAGVDPNAALHDVLEYLVEEVGISMQGLVLQGSDLGTITFPAELIAAPRIQIDVDVDHYQPQGRAWGQYVVLMVYAG